MINQTFTLPTPEYNAQRFDWRGNHGSQEASSLGLKVGTLPHTRCYEDAIDEGLQVTNPQTRTTICFYYTRSSKITNSWHYRSICQRFTLTIFND
jgi:hypothetical protein